MEKLVVGRHKLQWTWQQQELQVGDLHLCCLSVLWHPDHTSGQLEESPELPGSSIKLLLTTWVACSRDRNPLLHECWGHEDATHKQVNSDETMQSCTSALEKTLLRLWSTVHILGLKTWALTTWWELCNTVYSRIATTKNCLVYGWFSYKKMGVSWFKIFIWK